MSVPSKQTDEVISRWYHLIEGLNHSPKEFYAEIEKRVAGRDLPNASIGRVSFSEKGMFSSQREYLRIVRGDLAFDICGAPFGRDAFFVSYWLGRFQKAGCLSLLLVGIPGVGSAVDSHIRPMTYYEMDSAQMFQDTIHGIVLGHVGELIETNGIEPIPEHLRKPTIKQLSGL
ncbi:MAG: hypothetical protein KDN05_03340 [Verrucomicrobiae bacterium]|nr:hypothetical protein [Verrucomicrobiae bacterium]